MAEVTIEAAEAGEGRLPATCIVCGDAAHLYRRKTFHVVSWSFYLVLWIAIYSLYLFIPLAIVLTIWPPRKMRLHVPLCMTHKNHWFWRTVFLWNGAILPLVFVVFALAAVDLFLTPNMRNADEWILVMAASAAGVVLLLVPSALLGLHLYFKYSTIYAVRASGAAITLVNVAPQFAEALRVERVERDTSGIAPQKVGETQS